MPFNPDLSDLLIQGGLQAAAANEVERRVSRPLRTGTAQRTVAPWKLSGRADSTSSILNVTLRDVYQIPFDWWGLKVHVTGACATTTVNSLLSVAVSSNLATPFNPTGAWNPALFSGTALHTVPVAVSGAGSSNTVVSDLVSDTIYLPSIPRDDGGAGRLLFMASYRPSAGNTEASRYTIGSVPQPIGVSGLKCYFKAGDCITTPANFVSPTEWDNSHAAYFEFLTGDAPPLFLAVGDSRVGGIDSLTQGLGAPRIAVDTINSQGIKIAYANQGFGGQGSVAYYTNGYNQLQLHRPAFASYCPWTPNDADCYTQAGVNRMMLQACQWIEECRRLRAVPILETPPPIGGISAANEAFRRQVVVAVKALCSTGAAVLADSDGVFTDYSTSAGGWLPGLNFNTVHPNYAGHQLAALRVWTPLLTMLL